MRVTTTAVQTEPASPTADNDDVEEATVSSTADSASTSPLAGSDGTEDGSNAEQPSGESSATPATTPPVEERWAVVLAGASEQHDEILELSITDAADAGFDTASTNCDVGAAEALGMAPNSTYTVSIYFPTEAEAAAAATQFEGVGVLGLVTMIQTKCPE